MVFPSRSSALHPEASWFPSAALLEGTAGREAFPKAPPITSCRQTRCPSASRAPAAFYSCGWCGPSALRAPEPGARGPFGGLQAPSSPPSPGSWAALGSGGRWAPHAPGARFLALYLTVLWAARSFSSKSYKDTRAHRRSWMGFSPPGSRVRGPTPVHFFPTQASGEALRSTVLRAACSGGGPTGGPG